MRDNASRDSLLSVRDVSLPAVADGGTVAMVSADRRHILIALEYLFNAHPAPNAAYEMRVSLRRPPSGPRKKTEVTHLTTLTVRANERGEIWPY